MLTVTMSLLLAFWALPSPSPSIFYLVFPPELVSCAPPAMGLLLETRRDAAFCPSCLVQVEQGPVHREPFSSNFHISREESDWPFMDHIPPPWVSFCLWPKGMRCCAWPHLCLRPSYPDLGEWGLVIDSSPGTHAECVCWGQCVCVSVVEGEGRDSKRNGEKLSGDRMRNPLD